LPFSLADCALGKRIPADRTAKDEDHGYFVMRPATYGVWAPGRGCRGKRVKELPANPLENAIRQNVDIGVERLQGLQLILAPRVKDGKVKVVGGVYDLATGAVTMNR
jgi:hypothetical protein